MLGVWTEANLNCKLNDVSYVQFVFSNKIKKIFGAVTSKLLDGAVQIDGFLFDFQVINEGILDSILPYLVGYKKPLKTTSAYTPVIKKTSSTGTTALKKPASFGGNFRIKTFLRFFSTKSIRLMKVFSRICK